MVEFKVKVLDKAGRVVIPKWIRDAADIKPGDILSLNYQGKVVVE